MTDSADLCQKLQMLWDADFPMAQYMGVRIEGFENHTLTTITPLQGNTNTHGTAFAGSLYAIQALTAWGVLWLEIQSAALDASIIHASGAIDFATPIQTEIVARCSLQDPGAMRKLRDSGRLRLDLTTEVWAEGRRASIFTGHYVARIQ